MTTANNIPALHTTCTIVHRDAEKRNRFSFMNKSFNIQRNLTKLVLLLLMNIAIDVTLDSQTVYFTSEHIRLFTF